MSITKKRNKTSYTHLCERFVLYVCAHKWVDQAQYIGIQFYDVSQKCKTWEEKATISIQDDLYCEYNSGSKTYRTAYQRRVDPFLNQILTQSISHLDWKSWFFLPMSCIFETCRKIESRRSKVCSSSDVWSIFSEQKSRSNTVVRMVPPSWPLELGYLNETTQRRVTVAERVNTSLGKTIKPQPPSRQEWGVWGISERRLSPQLEVCSTSRINWSSRCHLLLQCWF